MAPAEPLTLRPRGERFAVSSPHIKEVSVSGSVWLGDLREYMCERMGWIGAHFFSPTNELISSRITLARLFAAKAKNENLTLLLCPETVMGGKAKHKNESDIDLDNILEEINAAEKKKKRGGKKGGEDNEEEQNSVKRDPDEVSEFAKGTKTDKLGEINEAQSPKADNGDEGNDEQDDNEDNNEEGVSAKTLKNRKKKAKKKLIKENEPTSETKEEAKPKKETKPTSEAARRAREMLRRVEEAEALQKEQEEAEKQIELEAQRAAEKASREAEAEKERRRIARLEKREKARKEGKLLSAKEKAALAKKQAILEQLEAQGIVIPQASGDSQKGKRIVDDRKKKKKNLAPKAEPEAPAVVEEKAELIEPQKQVEEVVDDDWDVSSDSSDDLTSASKKAPVRVETRVKEVRSAPTPPPPSKEGPRLRSPICCILGHVDTGKTKLLDKIRKTNVQDNEAGGITQQIGATFCPAEALWEQCKKVDSDLSMDVPGLLIIDTPGHESFNNLRARGSSLCDIAILVVDIMHGLEAQTRESLNLLKARKCPFIIALNKIDRMYDWKACEWRPTREALAAQPVHAREEFERRLDATLTELQGEGMNCEIYWKNKDTRKVVSVVPSSAINGEGLPDILMLLIKLTQEVMTRTLELQDNFQCTILEVKAIDGLGVTIDVILANGTLHEGDQIVVCGMTGPIHTTIRALLTPQPMRELRVKGEYIHHKSIHAAMGVKISAQGLDEAVAGTSVLRVENGDEVEDLKEAVMSDMTSIFESVDRSGSGVYVMASTLGSLEALLQFLKQSSIPVFAVNIGPVHKMDVKKASVMREKGHPELSVILAFDIKVDPEADREAKSLGVRIMSADIIYHLFDEFTKYVEESKAEKKKDKVTEAVFPCQLSVIQQYVFNKKDPIVMGVKVDEGILVVNTPLAVADKENLFIGRVTSLEHNKKPVERATKGMEVAIKITGESHITFGRHFDHTNKLYSRVTRDSIDCLKEYFRDDLTKDDWRLMITLKKIFEVV